MAAINDVYELSFFITAGSQVLVNVVHMQCTSITGVSPTDKECVDRFSTDMGAKYKTLFTNNAQYKGARLKRIVPAFGFPQFSTLANGAGVQGGDNIPSQCCGLISWYTDVAARTARGRTYLPMASEANSFGVGAPDAAGLQNLNDWAVALSTAWDIAPNAGASARFRLAVYSRILKAAFWVTRFIRRTNWATQRRRSQINRADQVAPVAATDDTMIVPTISLPGEMANPNERLALKIPSPETRQSKRKGLQHGTLPPELE